MLDCKSPDELKGQLGNKAKTHWHSLFNEHFLSETDRYSAMQRIVMEQTRVSEFDPRLITLFQSIINQRYFDNSPIFLNSSDIHQFWKRVDVDKHPSFNNGEYSILFPSLEAINAGKALPTFGFLSIPATKKYRGFLNSQILANVKNIVLPLVALKPNLINALEKNGLLDGFISSMRVVIEHSNHDYIHGLTNTNRDEEIPEGFDFKSKTYLKDFVNPDMSRNGFRVEECAVVEMNRLIFEHLRAQPDNQFIQNFSNAVDEVAGIILELKKVNENEAANSARIILRNFLSFLFDKKLLDKTSLDEWGSLVRTAETRQDIKLCKFIEPRVPKIMAIDLSANKTRPIKVAEKVKKFSPAENDEYCAIMLKEGRLIEVPASVLFYHLAEAVSLDLKKNGLLLTKEEQNAIREAAKNPFCNRNGGWTERVRGNNLGQYDPPRWKG